MLSNETLRREGVEAKIGQRVVVHLAVAGSTYGDIPLEPGRVLKLSGMLNDHRLIYCRTLVPVPEGTSTLKCKLCKSAEFIDQVALGRHERSKHAGAK